MTYFEKIRENEFGLHVNQREASFIISLLMARSEPEAKILLTAMRMIITPDNTLPTTVYHEIELCHKCKGTGQLKRWNEMEDLYEKSTCPACAGKRAVVKITSIRYEKISDEWQRNLILET